ncbi:hypothetical protein [Geopsychrobacter electrodiphilus]|uniref:hypothetical protein n=1 Tax=Geopsychrobacter electrodiphilus TaxID=225196 RepID=UPI0003801886|nr:hypothetical protein [Geopsychrobacter electrodiphilus]
MKRRFIFLILLLMPLIINGCGDGNPNAPTDNQPHPQNWLSSHPAAAQASADFAADCTLCHAADLKGNDAAVSCYSCHVFNTSPPFTFHPADWTNPYVNHRGYGAQTDLCKNCHGASLQGSTVAPSCFSTSYNAQSCHAAGPGLAPHPLDGSFLIGSTHGPVAKADLTMCQACHGQAGGPGSNPRFNRGIVSQGGTGCEACHGEYLAHPSNWEGYDGPTFHGTAGNMQNACTLCHGANLEGGSGPSCASCHGGNPLN